MPALRPYTILLLLVLSLGASARAADLECSLILAGNDPAPLDRRKDQIEGKLLRSLPQFKTFNLLDQQSLILNKGGTASTNLGKEFKVTVEGKGSRYKITWSKGKQDITSTTTSLSKGRMYTFGGMSHKGGKLVLVLRVK